MASLQIILIAVPIFIILLVIIFRTIKNSLKFDTGGSLILSVCVSLLATIGLNSNIRGTVVPYATLAVCILLAALIAFLFKTRRKAKDRFSDTLKKNPSAGIENRRKYETDDDRMKR